VQWSRALRSLEKGAGYLRIDSFAGYAKVYSFDAGADALDAALDEIMKDASELRGLVIDVRINAGGADPSRSPGRRAADRQTLRGVRQARQRREESRDLDRAAVPRPFASAVARAFSNRSSS